MADADLIRAVRRDHEEIKALMAAVDAHRDADAFGRLVRKIVVHETTEQEIVHPLASRAPGGAPIVEARLDEEAEGTEVLEQLETMGVEDPGFAHAFAKFRQAVFAHAEREEREEHPKLIELVDKRRLVELGEIFTTEELTRIDTSV